MTDAIAEDAAVEAKPATVARDTLTAHTAKVDAFLAANNIKRDELSSELLQRIRDLRDAARIEAEKEAGLL